MKEATKIGHKLKSVVLALLRRTGYKPTYRESNYRRHVFQRLTPLSRFILILLCVIVVAVMGVLANQSYAAMNGNQLLSDQLTAQPLPTVPLTPIVRILNQFGDGSATAQADSTNTPAPPRPTATPDWSHAPWSNQLFKQPDGTLMAPQKVVAKATQDLAAYYFLQRDLTVTDWLTKRDAILTTYFTGTALADMQAIEAGRDLYAMNRAGRFSVEIRNFTADGLAAKAGIITRDWVSDVYDVQTKLLVARGRLSKDTLTIYTIIYDPVSGRWMYAHVDDTSEVSY